MTHSKVSNHTVSSYKLITHLTEPEDKANFITTINGGSVLLYFDLDLKMWAFHTGW